MKRLIAAALLVSSMALTGCTAKLTGPGGAGADVSKMTMSEQSCTIWVLAFGPFDNAILKKKADVVQYSLENYVVWGRWCAEGYTK